MRKVKLYRIAQKETGLHPPANPRGRKHQHRPEAARLDELLSGRKKMAKKGERERTFACYSFPITENKKVYI
jgi:hypothetical protein